MNVARPPMGFNTWNTFGDHIDEKLIREAADAMVDLGLKDAGYEYLVIDDCWSEYERDPVTHRIVPHHENFPNGMKPVADYVHSKGLKFGMYSSNGVRTCADYPASFDHEFLDAQTFADFGVDYLKYDNCFHPGSAKGKVLYSRMSMALRATGRDIVFSACNWGHEDVWSWIRSTGAHLYRSTGDIFDNAESYRNIARSQMPKLSQSAPGCFNDMDMLTVGMYGKGLVGSLGCNDADYRSQFALWCMFSAPLMLGCDIRKMNETTLNANWLKQDLTQSITISSQENNSNNVYVEVIARDRAGNERINRTPEGQIQIDITAPTIRISYDNNSPDAANVEFFKGSRTATIEVTERNFKGDDVALTLTNSNGAVPSISGWTTSGGTGNGDNTVHTATLSFSSDGDYTFDIAYTDLAENACTEKNFVTGTAAPQKFTIDGTVPKITVSYDNNTVVNGKYFASGRTATVVINEHNFDAARIQITATASLDGESITVPSKDVKWNDSGDNHSATIPYTADGDYTFDIKFTDMAGNVCDTPDFGTSTAGKDFVVDTDIDKPTITINDASGNGKAFKDDVVLAISFADINYDSYDVTLTRTRRNDIDVDVESEFISEIKVSDNAGEGVFDTFDKVQDNDGIYNLSVTLHDKAGNESAESIKRFVL